MTRRKMCGQLGCIRPGCTAPGYRCQVHHVEGWTAVHSPTNIDKVTLACEPDNRLVEKGGWTTPKLTYAVALRGVCAGNRRVARLSGRLPRRYPGVRAG